MSEHDEELGEEVIGQRLLQEWLGEPPNDAELEVAARLGKEGAACPR